MKGEIYKISGPIVVAKNLKNVAVGEQVEVGNEGLIGEINRVTENEVYIQVYEDTTGLKPGEPVKPTGRLLSIQLGPGLIGSILDGTGRRLEILKNKTGVFITRGEKVPTLPDRTWHFVPEVKKGDVVDEGAIIGNVEETSRIAHRIMVPPGIKGEVEFIHPEGDVSIDEPVAKISGKEVFLYQWWPVRKTRPYKRKLLSKELLFTGQRVIDFFFPILKGGAAAIPGGFGTGKTVLQHQLAKWSDADIVVYIGCGERGNEMTQVLTEFPEIKDPRTGKSIMERTILIANTSNMPVTAREASIYTGITIAEYYRDMGYHVALMADSTSRWAEALREIAGRMEEMPAEEGFPAYLASRLAQFYERAGLVETLSGKTGSVSIIGAVSPPGGDFSEPVTMNTKRMVGTFWALSKELAWARHFPSIDWMESYSGYLDRTQEWWAKKDKSFEQMRAEFMKILEEDNKLQQIVKLVGPEALPDQQRLVVEMAKIIKEAFLQQNALDPVDTYCSPEKQLLMARVISKFYKRARQLMTAGRPVALIIRSPVVLQIKRMKYFKELKEIENLEKLVEEFE